MWIHVPFPSQRVWTQLVLKPCNSHCIGKFVLGSNGWKEYIGELPRSLDYEGLSGFITWSKAITGGNVLDTMVPLWNTQCDLPGSTKIFPTTPLFNGASPLQMLMNNDPRVSWQSQDASHHPGSMFGNQLILEMCDPVISGGQHRASV